ncbi:cupin-like domain-containing protein [Pontixanthobacter sp. CEM42]|uniref:cupin-like domain-containing protein n=1 Tax=Pontixanthobacter sp. CEM42 TaxID=2792077 RepID=UPI001ADFAC9A|nr:cupin-like domain-containing protein [Pontixanthobacter sp. CEM42]
MTDQLKPIPEIDRPSVEQFQRDIYFNAQPVVMRGIAIDLEPVRAASQSPEALNAWLKGAVGQRDVGIMAAKSAADSTFHYEDDLIDVNFDRDTMDFGAFIDAIMAPVEGDTSSLYLQGTEASNLSEGLRSALRLPYAPASSEPSVWMGNKTTAQTHFDLSQNIALVISGQRRFTLFPPEQVANLYMSPVETAPCGTPISMARLDRPDFLKHPRFREALEHAVVADLEPGDAIFIPYMWWHQVQASGPLNMLVNYWWNEYDDFGSPMFAMLHAVMTVRDMPPAMRSAWKAMFDHFVFGGDDDGGARSMDHMPIQSRGGLGPISPNMRPHLWRGIASGIAPHLAPPGSKPR